MEYRKPLALLGVSHVSRVCSDLVKSFAFYSDVLGFAPVKRPSAFNWDGAWLFNYGIGLHLTQGCPVARPSKIEPKSCHVSFQAQSLEDVEVCLQQSGIEYVKQVFVEDGIQVGQLFFHDPDNNMIEVCNCDELPVVPLTESVLACANMKSAAANAGLTSAAAASAITVSAWAPPASDDGSEESDSAASACGMSSNDTNAVAAADVDGLGSEAGASGLPCDCGYGAVEEAAGAAGGIHRSSHSFSSSSALSDDTSMMSSGLMAAMEACTCNRSACAAEADDVWALLQGASSEPTPITSHHRPPYTTVVTEAEVEEEAPAAVCNSLSCVEYGGPASADVGCGGGGGGDKQRLQHLQKMLAAGQGQGHGAEGRCAMEEHAAIFSVLSLANGDGGGSGGNAR